MTVLIYVDTSKQVGDPDHLKVFANEHAAKHGCKKTTPKAWLSNMSHGVNRIGEARSSVVSFM